MNLTRLPLSYFVERLQRGEPFTFARYGDGEWLCLLGARGHNCDGHEYFPDLGAALRQTLTAPWPYLHAIGPKATQGVTGVREFIAEHCRFPWYSTETFLEASLKGELYPLVEALRERRVLFVGPEHLQKLPLPRVGLVPVPPVNCWLAKDCIKRDILRAAERADVLAFSAGMTTKVLIYELYPVLGETHTLIDFGSLWDIYCGVDSRRYARRMGKDLKYLLHAQNFGQEHHAVHA